jgi:hypothetical protein
LILPLEEARNYDRFNCVLYWRRKQLTVLRIVLLTRPWSKVIQAVRSKQNIHLNYQNSILGLLVHSFRGIKSGRTWVHVVEAWLLVAAMETSWEAYLAMGREN